MDDPPSNFGDPTVVPATNGKKKKASQATKKPRSELAPEELPKLDVESVKRRNRRDRKDAAIVYAIELTAVEAARQKADAQEQEDIVSKALTLLVMGLCRPTSLAAVPVVLVGRPASVVPLPDVVDHAVVARFPSA
ncbi:Subtilisin-like protease [Hordeum vulgare]|nr:Subtilisin-like protease [Hordeum vulgare]